MEDTTEKSVLKLQKWNLTMKGFAYAGAKSDSLTDISFKAMKGQTIGAIGGTGSGKSTLVNPIPRFYDVREGTVLIDGKDVRDLSLTASPKTCYGYPRELVLFKGTPEITCAGARKMPLMREIWHALDVAQARDFVEAKEKDLTWYRPGRPESLSGGQRQRLTIVRALVRIRDPDYGRQRICS